MSIPSKLTRKYRPKLSSLMNLCDTNYMLMLKLLANNENIGEQRSFFISDLLSYTLTVKEVTRYTSVVNISQDTQVFSLIDNARIDTSGVAKKNKNLSYLFHPAMDIRLFHDARMAEVISSQDIRCIKPRYDYPNPDMHHPDEKQQMNQFLKEWLQLCLRLGKVDIAFLTD